MWGQFMKKTRGKKSCATVPLNKLPNPGILESQILSEAEFKDISVLP
jgi:hypothetical protein